MDMTMEQRYEGPRSRASRRIGRFAFERSFWTSALALAVSSGLIGALSIPAQAAPPAAKSKVTNDPGTEEAASAPEGPAPKIQVDEAVHDFGTTWVGPTLKHSYKITNAGEAPLEITKVRPACGCTVAGAYPKSLAPGETGEFPFSVNSNKLRGKYEKSITISSNDPVNPSMKLKIRGECKRYVDVLPTNANFGKITTEEPQERVLKIKNNTDQPLKLTLSKTDDQNFKFDLVENVPGQEYDLHVRMEPPYVAGSTQADTTLVTNIEEQNEIRIRASAQVPERLEVQPSSIVLESDGNQAYSRPIRFTNYGSNPVKLLDVTSDDPEAVQVAFRERTAGRAYTVNVNIPAGYKPNGPNAAVTLKTDDPQTPEVKIPIRVTSPQNARDTVTEKPAEALIGKPVPSFRAGTVDGRPLSDADMRGKVTVLDFFAPNCGYCKKQIPRLEEIRKAYADKDVRFVAVSQTMRKEYTDQEVQDTIKSLNFGGDLVINHDNNLGQQFKAFSFPTMVVVGKTGKIEAVNVGNIADLESRMKGQLDALLAGNPVTEVAQAAPFEVKKVEKPAAAPQPQMPPIEELVGKPAPDFELTTTNGKKLTKSGLTGKVAVLDFFAPNCGYCKKQIPRVEEIRKSYADKGVEFVAVSETMRTKFPDEEVKAKINELGFNGELAIDDDNIVGQMFSASGFPTMVVVGKSGNVEAVNVGNIADLESRLTGQLDALLAGKPVPQVAERTPPKQEQPPARRKRPAEEMVGQDVPGFELALAGGDKLTNSSLAGKVTVLDFFSTQCGHCMKQIPRVEEIRKQYAEKGVQFVIVGSGEEEAIKDKAKTLGFQGHVGIDGNKTMSSAFKVRGVPSMAIVGKTGKIEAVNVGNVGDLEDRMKGQLDALLAGNPVPQIAEKTPPAPPAKPAAPQQGDVFGKPAPKFEAKTTEGKTISNETLAGTPTVLDFFATNCGHCMHQVPRVEKIRAMYADKGVRFIAVNQTMGKQATEDEAKAKLAELGFTGELVMNGDNSIGQLFGVRGFPTMVVLGKTGKVDAINVGNAPDLDTRVPAQLDALLAGQPIPDQYAGKPSPPRSQRRPAEELVGKPAPAFEALTTMNGKTLAPATFGEHPATVLNFVAANCGFCKKQVPGVESIREEYEKKGVRFINVVQTMRKEFTTEEAAAVFTEAGSHLELAHDPKNLVGGAFKASGFPTMVVVGRDGKVANVNIGAKPNIDTLLKEQLDKLIATN